MAPAVARLSRVLEELVPARQPVVLVVEPAWRAVGAHALPIHGVPLNVRNAVSYWTSARAAAPRASAGGGVAVVGMPVLSEAVAGRTEPLLPGQSHDTSRDQPQYRKEVVAVPSCT